MINGVTAALLGGLLAALLAAILAATIGQARNIFTLWHFSKSSRIELLLFHLNLRCSGEPTVPEILGPINILYPVPFLYKPIP